jgi:hypothetical protein
MANKLAAETVDSAPAMDYSAHDSTYRGFIAMVKWGIYTMVLTVLSLYCFIEANQPLLGALLLVLIPVVIAGKMLMKTGSRRTR